MKEHGIIFQGWGVRAILKNLKTMTRRPVTWANSYVDGVISKWWRDNWGGLDFEKAWVDPGPSPAGNPGLYLHVPFPVEDTVHRIYPRWQIGDLLWVKEMWAIDEDDNVIVFYRANDHETCGQPWRPSIFMPRIASRIDLQVQAIRPERVQEISPLDVCREGVLPTIPGGFLIENCDWIGKQQFRPIWDHIYTAKGYGWDANHWNWATTFKKEKP